LGTKDPRVDAYIAKSADFAKPILVYLRATMHSTCPDVKENIKWGFPHFDYKGIFAGMAAFKGHATFGFWKHTLIFGNTPKGKDAMGSFGRITSVKDLPPKSVIAGYIRTAMKLNDLGVKAVKKKAPPKKPLKSPPQFTAALKKNKSALAHFASFSPSKKRDYLDWILEAKTDETRDKRITTAVIWISEGKGRNWKYENC
jgi:hypothetical protein